VQKDWEGGKKKDVLKKEFGGDLGQKEGKNITNV